jgi:hypothetical protein
MRVSLTMVEFLVSIAMVYGTTGVNISILTFGLSRNRTACDFPPS